MMWHISNRSLSLASSTTFKVTRMVSGVVAVLPRKKYHSLRRRGSSFNKFECRGSLNIRSSIERSFLLLCLNSSSMTASVPLRCLITSWHLYGIPIAMLFSSSREGRSNHPPRKPEFLRCFNSSEVKVRRNIPYHWTFSCGALSSLM